MRLSEEELSSAWSDYERTRDVDLLDLLVRNYEPLARFLARRALSRAPEHQAADDLISSAHYGLVDAVQRFEPARGLKFETYASRRIAGAIIDGQRKDDPLTRSARKRVNALRDAQRALWEQLGRNATVTELAAALGEPESAVRDLLVQQQTLTTELDGSAAQDWATDEIDPHLKSLEQESADALSIRLARLAERDRAFVLLYYVERRTLREIGKVFGCSDSRCAQIRKEAMGALLLSA